MIISRLVIEDFGIFQGRHEIDLRPAKGVDDFRPVILIGGKNGAGKTTLLEAIRLCLYGRNALRTRTSRANYETYIADRMYRSPTTGKSASSAKIELSFEYIHTGVVSDYHAERTWHRKGNGVIEELVIYKNNSLLRDIDRQHWDDFLRDLIPSGVSDLFFFDGEQIQMLADEATETVALETAIDGLLNLDIVARLKADLGLYVRQQAQQEQSQLQELLELLRTQFAEAEENVVERRQDVASEISQLDGIRKKLSDARQALIREGAAFIQERDQLEAQLKEVARLLEQTRNGIREQANDLLPFTLAPQWTQRLRYRLEAEASMEKARLTRSARETQAIEVTKRLQDADFQQVVPGLQPMDWERIAAEVAALLMPTEEDNGDPLIHPFSQKQREQMTKWIDATLNDVPIHLISQGEQLEVLEEQQRHLQKALQQIPSDAVGQPLVDEFQEFSRREGAAIERLHQLENKLAEAETRRNVLDQQVQKVWEQLSTADSVHERVTRAAKIQVILNQYLTRITAIKLEELEGQIAEYFNRLCRKPHLVHNVNIDPDHYRVTLFTENGEILPKSSLSAGERQLYAMSLLWALRAASGRLLPIIVDTPMGRLDSDHRRLLITRFFSEAAHQIIVLSTDTEIDAETYETMLPIVARAYSLEHNAEEGRTEIQPRYFSAISEVSS